LRDHGLAVAKDESKPYDIAIMPELTSTSSQSEESPCVCLVGAGTVGRSILHDHLSHHIDVVLIDAYEQAITTACEQAVLQFPDVRIETISPPVDEMRAVRLSQRSGTVVAVPSLVIESVTENLSLKQSLFCSLRGAFGNEMVLASNTSNLRIADVFEPLRDDPNCCGLHFFMPVEKRPLVECISTKATSLKTKSTCETHAARLDKKTLQVKDSPGFVVNRLLAPYLNQSLLILEHGIAPEILHDAALSFGMPMSPLKLIDTIGIRTAFDSGRVFWQSFPTRLDPASILPGMVKAMRSATSEKVFFFHPDNAVQRETTLRDMISDTARSVIAKYQRNVCFWTTEEIARMLAIPMWIEAAEVLKTGLVDDLAAIELAMTGGLGFVRSQGFFDFFDSLGSDQVLHHIKYHGEIFRGLKASPELCACLSDTACPTEAVMRYCELAEGASL